MKQYFGILLLFLNFACMKQQGQLSEVTMTYRLTQCSDPWMCSDYGATDEIQLKNFLTRKNIEVIRLQVFRDETLICCDACHCGSNTTAFVTVPLENVSEMTTFKFKPL